MAGLRMANSRSAMVFAVALVLSLVLAAALASMVTEPLRRMARATLSMAGRGLSVPKPGSKLDELGALAATFNDMAAKLKMLFDDLVGEVETRKSRERELQESEARPPRERRALAFGVRDLDTRHHAHQPRSQEFLATNRALQAIVGYTAQELQELSPVDLMAEEEREGGRHRLAELREGKRANYEVVMRYRRKDGSPIWVNTFVSTIPRRREHTSRSILPPPSTLPTGTRRKVTCGGSRPILPKLEKLSHTGCWAMNTKTGELFWSQEEWRIFGLDPEVTQLSYQVFLDLVHPEDRDAFKKNSFQAVRNKEPYDILFRAVLRDGTIKHIHSVGHPFLDDAGNVVEYIGVSMDVTERKRDEAALQAAQAELARASRLTTIGELAASIAHEINQPLAAVVANGDASLLWLARDTPIFEEAREALIMHRQGCKSRERRDRTHPCHAQERQAGPSRA